LDGFQEIIGIDELPIGSIVRIVTDDETELTTISRDPKAVRADLVKLGNPARQFQLKEGSEVVKLNGKVIRNVGFSTMRRVPWLVIVGLPVEALSVVVAKGH
jgi:hypothetical protein